jgi:CRP/FNR family cyclic AMP-dependent transcriptional regulator
MRKVLYTLGQLNDEDAEWFTQAGKVDKVRAGETLIERGKHLDSLFFVLEGMMTVYAPGDPPIGLAGVQSGEVLGEMSFVDASPPSATVKADHDSLVLRIPRSTIQARLDEDQGFAARFYRAIAILLSDRLRKLIITCAPSSEGTSGESILEKDELDPNVLDAVTLAGSRFDRMLKKLRRPT